MQKTVGELGGWERVHGDPGSKRLRSILFELGDALFLLFVGIAAALAMQMMHRLGWPLALTWLIGMAVAMVIQTLLALSVAPILGSIESMVPSMVVAMVAPMAVCVFHLIESNFAAAGASKLGAAFGAGTFLWIRTYGYRTKRSLHQAFFQEGVSDDDDLGCARRAL